MIKQIEVKYSIPYEFILSVSRMFDNEKFEFEEEKFDKELAEKIKMNEDILKWIKKTETKIPSEFKDVIDLFFNGETCIRSIFLFYIKVNNIVDCSEFIDFLENKSGKHLMNRYFSLLSHHIKSIDYLTDEEVSQLLSDKNGVMEFVERLPFIPKRKWELLQMYNHSEEYKEKLIRFLRWYYSEIFFKEIKKIESLLDSKVKEHEKKITNYGEEYLTLLISTDYSNDTKNRNLVIIVSYYLEISYLIVFRDDYDEDIFILGYRHSELFVERKHGLLSNVYLFKALGDETRQNIIRLLSEKEWYGDELAQEIKVSNSTVSYHLSILMMEGLVKVKRIDNKNYVMLNRDNLQQVMNEAINRMLKNTKK
ncbi:MAG: winged helix-turn-helix domain-containing protein [Candidatus Cloacimonetes bacterium]|nr:winged helix-turn-helix domain-containing protein [Candidatus Cloacimonadota bacterium]